MSNPHAPRLTRQELRHARKILGLTSETLAERVGVRADTVRKWESGRYTIPYGVRSDLAAVASSRRDEIQDLIESLLASHDYEGTR